MVQVHTYRQYYHLVLESKVCTHYIQTAVRIDVIRVSYVVMYNKPNYVHTRREGMV